MLNLLVSGNEHANKFPFDFYVYGILPFCDVGSWKNLNLITVQPFSEESNLCFGR